LNRQIRPTSLLDTRNGGTINRACSLKNFAMELQLFDYSLEQVQWGERTGLDGKTLSLCMDDLQEVLNDLSPGVHVDFQIARPGEAKRIVHVLDAVMPIAKRGGLGSTFPGFEGAAELVGTGKTVRFKNLLVTVTGRFPHFDSLTPIEKPREGIVDMSGIGAPYSYGSDCFHLVLSLTPESSVSNVAFDQTLRIMALRCARFLAPAERSGAEAEKRLISLPPVNSALPKVVLIYQVQSQLTCARTFYYGEEVSKTLPTFVHPAEFFDGAAQCFIEAEPPQSANLYRYGAGFAHFLARFPPAASLAYLADVARLEWAVNCALHAPDVPPLASECFATVAQADPTHLVLVPHPSLTLLRAEYPSDAIWRAVLAEDDGALSTIDLMEGPCWLLVERNAEGVATSRLKESEWRFISSLYAGEAFAAAADREENIDVALVFAGHLAAGRFIEFHIMPNE